MLIIEGTDGVGKTRLAQRLVKELEKHGPWIYAWLNKLPKSWHFPTSYFPRMSVHIVQDRFHMSEIVYRAAREEKQLLHPEAYRIIDAWARLLGSVTVILTASEEWISRGIHQEEMHTREQIATVNDIYLAIAENAHVALDNHRYESDWDLHFHCCGDAKFPAEDDMLVNQILGVYLERLMHYEHGTVCHKTLEVR